MNKITLYDIPTTETDYQIFHLDDLVELLPDDLNFRLFIDDSGDLEFGDEE